MQYRYFFNYNQSKILHKKVQALQHLLKFFQYNRSAMSNNRFRVSSIHSTERFETMKATGIVRRIDDLGRVVIPKEIRRTMRIREGDPLEIYTDKEGGVIFKKYSLMEGLNDFAAQLCETLNRTTGRVAIITDRDNCIAAAGIPRREILDKTISNHLEQLMENRQIYQRKAGDSPVELCEDRSELFLDVAAPILSEGDVLGCVVFAGKEPNRESTEVEYKLAQSIATFLGRHMES